MNCKVCLVTGSAGFIGFHLSRRLLELGFCVVGYDNMNDYYDVQLKESRLEILKGYKEYIFYREDIQDKEMLQKIFSKHKPNIVINLAAQAGVRYSIQNPDTYIQSNIVGFANILECCKEHKVEHLLYASSSSVYGKNKKTPFSTEDQVDHPISLYAATKKSNELMAYTYSHLFNIPTTGLRFFTVYGEYGRPDMAYFGFSDKIMKDKPIQIFNYGDMKRDFTYIDDIVDGIIKLIKGSKALEIEPPYKIYNIGNNAPEQLIHFIEVLEKNLGKVAEKEYLPMQDGDVPITYADIDELVNDVGFKPKTSIEEGLKRFVSWYKEYYLSK